MNKKLWKKAVLVYPKFSGVSFWSFKKSLKLYVPRNEFGLPKRAFPPLGLMGLYNYLKPYYNELVLIDRNMDPRPLKNLIKDADHVYMGGMLVQERGLLADAQIVKELGKPLVLGGPVIDRKILEKYPLNVMNIIAVENESEMFLEKVLDDLANKKFGGYYEGQHCSPELFFKPNFSSINLNNYASMSIQIGRGCPWNCEFCDITARFGKKPRYGGVESIKSQFRQLYKLGWRKEILIVDDSFTAHPEKAIESLKGIYEVEKELGYQFVKSTQVPLDLADNSPIKKEVRNWLRKTNFEMLFIGVETNNLDSLKETGKFQNLSGEDVLGDKLSFITKETGAGVMMGIIYGFDNGTIESVDSLIEFINSTHVTSTMAGLLMALPYTKLWDRLKKDGRLKKESTGDCSDGEINFIPYNMSAEQAETNYLKLLKGIYNERAFFGRLMKELSLFNPKERISTLSIREGFYSLIRILTKENARMFWRHLYGVHKVARKRFSFLSPGYNYLIGVYFARCAKYTHFRGMVDYLNKQLKTRVYEDWQKHSWEEMLEGKVNK